MENKHSFVLCSCLKPSRLRGQQGKQICFGSSSLHSDRSRSPYSEKCHWLHVLEPVELSSQWNHPFLLSSVMPLFPCKKSFVSIPSTDTKWIRYLLLCLLSDTSSALQRQNCDLRCFGLLLLTRVKKWVFFILRKRATFTFDQVLFRYTNKSMRMISSHNDQMTWGDQEPNSSVVKFGRHCCVRYFHHSKLVPVVNFDKVPFDDGWGMRVN